VAGCFGATSCPTASRRSSCSPPTSSAARVAGEASLTFLGVGLRLPAISWGTPDPDRADAVHRRAIPACSSPSLFLCLFIGAFVLLGESIRDALDVKMADA
jgi:ABC-type dipeptide/oligopeptide/nickel transport system permease subunit